jgi:hypothetical protein
MDRSNHTLACLFSQLGMNNSEQDISDFISSNKGIPADITLSSAKIWNASQALFLSQAISEDADWAEIVDNLDVLLR